MIRRHGVEEFQGSNMEESDKVDYGWKSSKE